MGGSQYVSNKLLNNTNAFIGSNNSRLLFGLEETTPLTTTQLKFKSSMSRSIYLPDADDTLVGKNTIDVLKNKIINDATNTVYANGIRTATWTTTVGGSAPVLGNVFYYNGSNAVWVNAASLISLTGDVTGPINNTVVNTLGGGTLPVDQLVDLTTFQVLSNKNFDTEVYFSNTAKNRIFSVNFNYITGSSHTMLIQRVRPRDHFCYPMLMIL